LGCDGCACALAMRKCSRTRAIAVSEPRTAHEGDPWLEFMVLNYGSLHAEVLPFVRLREHFRIEGPVGRRENMVVVQYAGQKAGLLVDELLGEHQTVIKPLGTLFRHINGISGATILGNGRVALILDILNLMQRLQQEGGGRVAA